VDVKGILSCGVAPVVQAGSYGPVSCFEDAFCMGMDPLAGILEALLHDGRDRTVVLWSDVEKEIAIFADGIDQGLNDVMSS
jgi:hypothetical protein